MDVHTGNIYGPDDLVPPNVELIPLDEDEYDEILDNRRKEIEKLLRQRQQNLPNPGR